MTSLNREMISKRLRAIRNIRGLSQEEMGKITGKNAYYGNIERNQDVYSDSIVIELAEKLEVDPNWLLTGEGTAPKGIRNLLSQAELNTALVHPDVKVPVAARVPIPEFPKKAIPKSPKENPDRVQKSDPARNILINHHSTVFVMTHKSGQSLSLTVFPCERRYEMTSEESDPIKLSADDQGKILSELIQCGMSKAQEILQ